MHALPPSLDLVALHEFAAVLGTRMTDLLIISDAYSWVFKIVSWFFIALALSFWAPIAVLIVFDFLLWVYRLVFPAIVKTSRNRLVPDSLSHHVSTT